MSILTNKIDKLTETLGEARYHMNKGSRFNEATFGDDDLEDDEDDQPNSLSLEDLQMMDDEDDDRDIPSSELFVEALYEVMEATVYWADANEEIDNSFMERLARYKREIRHDLGVNIDTTDLLEAYENAKDSIGNVRRELDKIRAKVESLEEE